MWGFSRLGPFPASPSPRGYPSRAGCEECNNAHSSVCPKHGPLHPIPNRPVLTRARASLPLVLYIDRFLGGVFSKRRIPKRTQFGPVEGPLVRESELKDCYVHLKVMYTLSQSPPVLMTCEGHAFSHRASQFSLIAAVHCVFLSMLD